MVNALAAVTRRARRRSTPAAAARHANPVDPMGRVRGRYDWEHYLSGYDTVHTNRWVRDPNGPVLRSRMVGMPGDRHAPILDIDRPVDIEHVRDGVCALRVGHVDQRAFRRLVRGLRHLVAAGHVLPADADRVRQQYRARRRGAPTQPVVVVLQHPLRAQPSRTPGHFHVYVDAVMPFRTSVRFARALAVVDRDYVRVSKRTGLWQVNTRP